MNEKLLEALEMSINALEMGADLESVLNRFPGMEDDLRPLLEASGQARLLSISEVPEPVIRRGKLRVLQHATEMRETASKSQKQKRAIFTFPRLATSLVIALLFFFSGTGLVRASAGAIPGDQLYPVKRTFEDVRLLLVFNPEGRDELEGEFEQERLDEVDELLTEGRDESIEFEGVVTQQEGDLWNISSISVLITPQTQLPDMPVTIGTLVSIEGKTNSDGFVEADHIEILGSDLDLPTYTPTENKKEERDDPQNSSPDASGSDGQENSTEDGESHEDEEDSSSNEDDSDEGDTEYHRDGRESDSHYNDRENNTQESSYEDHSDEDSKDEDH